MKENRRDKAVSLMAAALVTFLSFVGLYALLGSPSSGDPDWMGRFVCSKVVAAFCLGLVAVILRGRPQSFGLPQNKQAR